jgi:DNA-binding transcriptional MocR family regulator
VYQQIRDRLQHLITSGALVPGDRLPSIRSLAQSLQVNKLTVMEAYDLLTAAGLVTARQGSGYFVDLLSPTPASLTSRFSPTQDVVLWETQGSPFFRYYSQYVQAQYQAGFIDLSCAYPQQLPDNLSRITRRVAGLNESLHHYDLAQGLPRLRQQIASFLVQIGLEVSPEHLMVTTGSMQGLSLVLRYFLQPGDWVVVESPTFSGMLAILEQLQVRIIGIPMDANGMNLELLAQYLHSHRPKLIYTISTLHNPTGITTSLSHRQALIQLAQHYKCPILEDNVYEGLHADPAPPPLKSLDANVFYVGSFSKTLQPGLRVGYIAVPSQHFPALLEQKLLQDLHSPTLPQAIVGEYLATGHYRRHLQRLRTMLKCHRNAMLQALSTYFPADARWTMPAGGMFLWVQLPNRFAGVLAAVHQQAVDAKILYTEGSLCFPARQGYPAIRLSFGNESPDLMEKGVAGLGEILARLAPPSTNAAD